MARAEASLGPCARDRLLGGRVALWQPQTGYRAATDPVLLAAACPATPGDTVLELGLGAGAASLCLAARVPGLALAGLELQPGYAELAAANAAAAGVALEVIEGDVAAPPATLRARRFDHVILNPPWHAHGPAAASAARDAAHREQASGPPLATWIDAALARCRPRGRLTMIHRAERLDTILATLTGAAGEIRVLPLAPREGRPAKRVIVTARTQVRGPLRLMAPLVVHQGSHHTGDRDDFSTALSAILRDAAPIDLAEKPG
ncbi:MAG: methyltransferase [Pseudomonadota bacterium]